jgi:hypothetical protein
MLGVDGEIWSALRHILPTSENEDRQNLEVQKKSQPPLLMYYRRRVELRNRILKWLQESQPPDDDDSSSQCTKEIRSKEVRITRKPIHQSVLYHPDFAEWESIAELNGAF